MTENGQENINKVNAFPAKNLFNELEDVFKFGRRPIELKTLKDFRFTGKIAKILKTSGTNFCRHEETYLLFS